MVTGTHASKPQFHITVPTCQYTSFCLSHTLGPYSEGGKGDESSKPVGAWKSRDVDY